MKVNKEKLKLKLTNDVKSKEKGETVVNEEITEVRTEEEKAQLTKDIMDGLDKLEEIVIEAHQSKFKAWRKGFGAGYGTAIVGIASGYLISKAVRKFWK